MELEMKSSENNGEAEGQQQGQVGSAGPNGGTGGSKQRSRKSGGSGSKKGAAGGSKRTSFAEASSVLDMDTLDDGPVDEEEEIFPGQQVNQLLTQLGSQIQNRVRAKKQKLDKSFQAIQVIQEKVLTFQKEQAALRGKLIEEFQQNVLSLNGKLNEIIQLQLRNEEKQGKMMLAVTRENEEVKQLVSQCSQYHNSVWDKFHKESHKLELQFEEEAAGETEQALKEILLLQKKLVAESQKEGSEMFSRFGL